MRDLVFGNKGNNRLSNITRASGGQAVQDLGS